MFSERMEQKQQEEEKALGSEMSEWIGWEKMWRMSDWTGVGEWVGNGERKEEEEEEEEVEEDIFRAAPNQLLHQFLSVGVKLRAKERDTQVQH